jgi:hypothetical protein
MKMIFRLEEITAKQNTDILQNNLPNLLQELHCMSLLYDIEANFTIDYTKKIGNHTGILPEPSAMISRTVP